MVQNTITVAVLAVTISATVMFGLTLQAEATFEPSKFWDGGGDGTNWSHAPNWNGDTPPVSSDHIAIDNNPGSNVVVHLDIDFTVEHVLTIDSGDRLVIDPGNTLTERFVDTIQNNGVIVNNGIINNLGLIINNGIIENACGSIIGGGLITGLGSIIDTPCQVVGGEILPVTMTSLFVAGAFTNAYWILPMLGGIAGAVIVGAIRRKLKQ